MVPKPTCEALMASVADSDDSAYLLSHDNKLLEVNTGFRRFALENGGVDIDERWRGQSVLRAIAGPLRAYYDDAFRRVRETEEPWQHAYECSSPERVRCFHMTVYPVGPRLVTIHALRVDTLSTWPKCPPDDARYVRGGLIRMCSNCRRVHNPSGHQRWDWVPAYLHQAPATVSHGLCEACAWFYWP